MDAFRMSTKEQAEGPGLTSDPINIALSGVGRTLIAFV